MTKKEAITALGDRNNLLWGMSKEEQKYYSEALDMAISALSKNKGEWIEHDVKELRDLGYYRCSVCRKGFKRFDKGIRKSDVPWIDGQPFELHIVDNFCPNCGADMRGN